ncbi:hypothetical protein KM043_005155 [Ampulex compressa]|nr:hypothetical protein KM043_005155 [Ampulex compressa]
MRIIPALSALCLFCLWQRWAEAKRILVVTVVPSFSHQIVFRSLCLGLHRRGHEMVVVTPNPIKDPTMANYTEIDLSESYALFKDKTIAGLFSATSSPAELDAIIFDKTAEIIEQFYRHPQVKRLASPDSKERFDAVLVEFLGGPAINVFANLYDAPLIGLLSVDLHRYHHYDLGQPLLPSHPSNWEQHTTTGTKLSFWQRLNNFIECWAAIYRRNKYIVNTHQSFLDKYIGAGRYNAKELTNQASLILVNHDLSIAYSRPTTPNVVFFNGLHVQKKPPPLPNDLKQFLDNNTDCFVYASFGTNVKTTELPQSTLESIIEVFSNLPCKVVWKYDGQELRPRRHNIYASSWISQQSVLAHPKIKLFVYQGGLQSTEEAVHYAVPLLGVPIMFDQGYRITKLTSLGVAKHFDIATFDENNFDGAIREILTNDSYKENMIYLNKLYNDKPYDSLENALWWIEHVMRHKGAPHLGFNGMHVPWYQRYDMDVVAFLGIIGFFAVFTLTILLFQCIIYILKYNYAFNYFSKIEEKKVL